MIGHPRRIECEGRIGVVVPIEESVGRWSEIRLDDGSARRMKPVGTRVMRVDDRYDVDGSPSCLVQAASIVCCGRT